MAAASETAVVLLSTTWTACTYHLTDKCALLNAGWTLYLDSVVTNRPHYVTENSH